MHWTRSPRLNSAVATVAVEMVLSLSRVVSLSLVMVCSLSPFVIPGWPEGPGPESITTFGSMDSGLAAARRPGMTRLINRRLADRGAESRFEEVEIAAVVGLLDVAREHPAIAALEAPFGLLPFGAASGKLGFAHIEIDGARGDIEGDAVAVSHQSERSADIGFRRHMQNAGAVARAAHPRIRQAHHVA